METTRHVIVEHEGATMNATLHNAVTLQDLWVLFALEGIRPTIITMANGIARVNLDSADLPVSACVA